MTIDWEKVPPGESILPVKIVGSDGKTVDVTAVVKKRAVKVRVSVSPTQNVLSTEVLRCGVSFDEKPPRIVNIHEKVTVADWKYPSEWNESVSNSVKVTSSSHLVEAPGAHRLKL